MNKNEKIPDKKSSAVDPTDPRQAAFVAGGITGAVAGATLGSVAGPIGTAVGAAVGGVAGAKTAENISVDTAAEDHYWRKTWNTRPYASFVTSYDEIAPAYRTGYELPEEIYSDEEATFETSESVLRSNYEQSGSKLPWDDARPAARDAFDRVMTSTRNRKLTSDRH